MHYISEQNIEEKRKNLEIYILRQVNMLDKGFRMLAKSSTVAGKLFQILTTILTSPYKYLKSKCTILEECFLVV